ncbi:CorA family divalent cation transporter [Streptomyces sp. WAC 01529]|uniref:CorA family divalent cation transporter n=1 Tax=Streptomyces sp. WAC 01529 TaxID=2203205 RepID=UPI0023E81C9B|nr:CorA family divalent cation transporter [Streptomyces sp. WAC 01529]
MKDSSSQVRNAHRHIDAGQRHQVDNFKKISSWAAILFAPTLVGTIYGMNFDTMPELKWAFGYPFAILLMAAVCVSLYFIFKRRDWL